MGAQPGEFDECVFNLSSHENVDVHQAAEKIAEHFSRVSREFPPLNSETLPDRVIQKISFPESESQVPILDEYEVFAKIKAANKPKSGIRGDLLRRLVTENGPELSTPVCTIFNSILVSSKQGVAK